MAFAVIATANHFVIDVLAGVVVVAVGPRGRRHWSAARPPLSWTGVDATSNSTRPEPFVVAHRGGNWLHTMRRAEGLGISLIEADLRLFHARIDVRHLKSVGPLPPFWDRWQPRRPGRGT